MKSFWLTVKIIGQETIVQVSYGQVIVRFTWHVFTIVSWKMVPN